MADTGLETRFWRSLSPYEYADNAGVALGEISGLGSERGIVRFSAYPEKGVSLIDAPGMPFHDPDADAALFEALERTVAQTGTRRLVRLPHHINDADFAQALVESWTEIAA